MHRVLACSFRYYHLCYSLKQTFLMPASARKRASLSTETADMDELADKIAKKVKN